MASRAALLLVVLAVPLAGCLSTGNSPHAVDAADTEDFKPSGNLGALRVTYLDDREEAVPGGFILLEPIGLTSETNGDGQVAFIGLEPGVYRIKFQKEGHEAAPLSVSISAGRWTEETVLAQRTST